MSANRPPKPPTSAQLEAVRQLHEPLNDGASAPASDGPVLARWEGRCASCYQPIERGDHIIRSPGRTWRHAGCKEPES